MRVRRTDNALAAQARPVGRPRNRRSKQYWVFLRRTVAALILALSWFAIVRAPGAPPDLIAEAAMAVDVETGDILFEKNARQRMYPASLTKLMTAILLSENREPADVMRYSVRAEAQMPAKLGLPADSTMTAADAMDALLMGSANDVAYMIAESISGTAAGFAKLMNTKAQTLGLGSTHFVKPSGLHDDDHYSSAADLVALFEEALQNPWIRETMEKQSVTLSSVLMTITNTNPLLGIEGCVAGKTGYTSMAGKCLAALYERNGRQVIAVVLKSETDDTLRGDMEAVIRWSFR